MSTPTSSNNLNATPQARPAIGREETLDRTHPSAPAERAGNTLPREASGDTTMSGMVVGSQLPAIVAKDVDSTVLQGSHKSGSDDVSKNFSTDAFKNQAGPRGETTDTPEAGA